MRPYYEFMRKVLKEAQQQRSYMPLHLKDGQWQPYWHDFEKMVMWKEVNRCRMSMGLEPVEFHRIARAEQMASGHVDYTSKFALYCAELIDRKI